MYICTARNPRIKQYLNYQREQKDRYLYIYIHCRSPRICPKIILGKNNNDKILEKIKKN